VKNNFIPEQDIRILREFPRYLYKLVSIKSSGKNRFQNTFTVCNVTVDTCVNEMIVKYEDKIALLCAIPGINRNSAITIISEIGINMEQFASSQRLCC